MKIVTRRASMQDMAKTLNLSIATVSRALSGHRHTSEDTRQRVLALAQELGFAPNPLASALITGRSSVIGVLVPHISGFFFPEVVHGITRAANQAGFDVMVCESGEDEQQEQASLQRLLNARVGGLLVSLAKGTRTFEHFEAVRQQQVSVVFFDRVPEHVPFPSVTLDNYRGAYQAVSHLIEQGCTRIAHLTGDWQLPVFAQRHRGYVAALHAHGLALDPQLVYPSDLSLDAGRAGMGELLRLPAPPDGVFSSQDTAALGALQAGKEHGLLVPHELAFATFSTEKIAPLAEPALTCIDLQCAVMGQAAAQLLLELLGANMPPPAPRHLILTPQLLVRGSSLKATTASWVMAR